MSLSASLGPIRSTVPREAGAHHPAQSYKHLRDTMRDAGLMRHTPVFYWLVLGGLILAFGGLVTGFILLGDSWFQLLIAGGLGILFTQVAFVGHEATHRQVFPGWKANEALGRTLSVITGISYDWWMQKHTRHHGAPNQVGADPDIDPDTVVFTDEDAAKLSGLHGAFVRRQGWLFFPLILLEGLNLHRLSFAYLAKPSTTAKYRWLEFSLLILRHAAVLSAVFLTLPLGMAFAFLGVQLGVFGFYMGAAFAPNHVGMPVIPADQNLDFLRRQVLTSRNLKGGWWATVLYGGLNHQVEHHLFPTMSRPKLARAREIVREFCQREGVLYTEESVGLAYRNVIGALNRIGMHAVDPFTCAMASAYRRR